MPRARRNFVPGYVWHITQRCHKKEFLLRFKRDRKVWKHWLFEAKKRFGCRIFNYIVTSNHIHLLIESKKPDDISSTMQMVSGRTAQAYNKRKTRPGAFWQDRYHATVVETDEHFLRCMTYIDLNMVRAGAAAHPSAWDVTGYHEFHEKRQRYRIIDLDTVLQYSDVGSLAEFRLLHLEWLDSQIATDQLKREPEWTESIAVGSPAFTEEVRRRLDPSGRSRKIVSANHESMLT